MTRERERERERDRKEHPGPVFQQWLPSKEITKAGRHAEPSAWNISPVKGRSVKHLLKSSPHR